MAFRSFLRVVKDFEDCKRSLCRELVSQESDVSWEEISSGLKAKSYLSPTRASYG